MTSSAARRRVPLALLALALVFPIITLAPPVLTSARAADTTITFEGGGWGHAVGLSQYGAYGMALLDGADTETILEHYFTGASVARLGIDVAAAEPLWVNLENRVSATTLRPTAITGDGVPFTVRHDGATFPAVPGDAIKIEVIGSSDLRPTCRVTVADAISEGTCTAEIVWDGDTATPTSRLTIESSTAGPDDPAASCTNPDWNAIPTSYRPCSYNYGTMHIRPAGSDRLHVLLEIDVDDYIEGVSEMPYYWALPAAGPNGTAALEAQAIAARSYAISRQIARGAPADRTCGCHIVDTAADQRYVGWGHNGLGHETWIDAARSTAGMVLVHPSVGGGGRPITAYYGSSSYGTTESGIDGFAQTTAYLQSVDDHWAVDPAVRNPYATWSKSLTGSDIADGLGLAGRTVIAAAIASCGASGAALQVRFTDDQGTETVRAARDLRTLLGLRSPQITAIDGVAGCGAGSGDGEPTPGELRIDDGASGDSIGNGDGRAQCAETLELTTFVANTTGSTLSGVEATITTEDPYLDILHNTTSDLPSIPAGQTAGNANDWDLAIADPVPDGHRAEIEIIVTAASAGPWTLAFSFPIGCAGAAPAQTVTAPPAGVTVDDGVFGDSVGNNNGLAECGETIELYVELENLGEATLTGLTATLTVSDPNLTLLYNSSSGYPSVAPGRRAENSNDWDLAVGEGFSDEHTAPLQLTLNGLPEPVVLDVTLTLSCASASLGYGGVVIDDGPTGDSVGNNNGSAECGEVVELSLLLANGGGARDLTGLSATIVPVDPALTLLHNAESAYPDLAPGETAYNTNDWDLAIGPVKDGHTARYRVKVTGNGGLRETFAFDLPIGCDTPSPVTVASLTVDDGVLGDSVGNNNKVGQCGEVIELYVALENTSGSRINGFSATLATDDPYATIMYNTSASYAGIDAGVSAENLNDWDITLADEIPDRHVSVFTLRIDALALSLEVPVNLRCAVQP